MNLRSIISRNSCPWAHKGAHKLQRGYRCRVKPRLTFLSHLCCDVISNEYQIFVIPLFPRMVRTRIECCSFRLFECSYDDDLSSRFLAHKYQIAEIQITFNTPQFDDESSARERGYGFVIFYVHR